jgi:nicotinamide-nucleotide adenylyltransferase
MNKKARRHEKALFIGRFQPFHKGHLHAVKYVVARHGHCIIAIGSSNQSRTYDNPFTANERKKMIAATLAKEPKLRGKYSFEFVPDVGNDKGWARLVLSKRRFAIVVTGNAWVRKCLSPYAKVEMPHFLRRAEYNATRIRGRMAAGKEWKSLVPVEVFNLVKPGLPAIVRALKKKRRQTTGSARQAIGATGGV